ncbi:DUF2254 domain-containing protein [Kangiella marina]|uniref:DUF2254 domain-containing protein n=1 Tax=Kangiella marina TaxID=1079178 RepID=A0ABP8IG56_9GAMM
MQSWASKLYNLWELTRSSLFYVPVIISLMFIGGILLIFRLELSYTEYVQKLDFLYAGSTEDAKTILQTILSALITMTTLVISITMVVLSLSASQLGPRLIKIFMSSRLTQIYIGVFFGSIALTLTLLILLHDQSTFEQPPKLTISCCFVLTFINLFVLLGYVNHVARSGIADTTIERVTQELEHSLSRLTDSARDHTEHSTAPQIPKHYSENQRDIYSSCSGYIQNIQYPALVELANKHDLLINIECRAGDYVFTGQKVGTLFPKEHAQAEVEICIVECIDVGSNKTGTQDIEYSIRHLAEIGLRALSPGINDNFTAITVLDKLSGVLSKALSKDLPQHIYHDQKNQLRLIGKSVTQSDIVDSALSQIRDAGKTKPDVLHHLIQLIGTISQTLKSESAQQALNQQVDLIKQHIHDHFHNKEEETYLLETLEKYSL